MSGTIHFKASAAVLAAWLLLATAASTETISRMSTRFLARGEQALLEVAVASGQLAEMPVIPAVADVEIKPAGTGVQNRLLAGRRLEYYFEYLVSSYATGPHVLPAIEVLAGGLKTRTEPLAFTVFNPDDLQWSETMAGQTKIRYASAFRCMNPHPYNGETTPVEIKIFVPRDLFVEDWGIPDFQRDGVTSWRFQPSPMRGQINLLGMPYVAVAYPSTLTPTRTGPVGIGPAAIRLMTTEVVMDGILRRIPREVNLNVAKLDIESKPLPKGAPEGFDNAIGSFKVAVTTALTTAQEGDPIPLEIVVSGSGNLDTLRPPKPVADSGWKLYDATTEQRGEERRELSGRTVFHQFIRPLELKPAVPAFRLVYFDPQDATYKTLTTEPIPLQMTPAKTLKTDAVDPPAALAVPLERMTDILGVLRVAPLITTATPRLPGWAGHALAGLLALGLIARALWLRHAWRLHKDPNRTARLLELRSIARSQPGDDTGFLMAAGRFIERWLGTSPPPAVLAVLAERDAVCFQQETPAAVLDPKRRAAILKLLRQSALVWLAAALLATGCGQARAADEKTLAAQALQAYDAANYDAAIQLWLQAGSYADLTAEALYNIGNACYRAGSPGQAALYYRRSLARDPGQQESRQNLRFIERKCGAISVHRPDYQYALARLPLTAWQDLLWTGVWLCGLAALVFPATRAGAKVRLTAVVALAVGPLLAAVGTLGWYYYPSDAGFAPVGRQAVVIADKAIVHADAARTSPEVIDAPPGSLCEVIGEAGRWTYIAFATKTRGWIPSEAIEKVVPATPPAPPNIRKPKADGKSA